MAETDGAAEEGAEGGDCGCYNANVDFEANGRSQWEFVGEMGLGGG